MASQISQDPHDQDTATDVSRSEKKESGSFWEMLRTVFYALILALVVRSFAYEPFSIPSASMVPNLKINDYLFVSKFSYGYSRYSFPLGLPIFEERIWETRPERGDVAVFKLPADNSTDYIKRIVGLPGDSIQVRSGFLFINGRQVERRRVEDYVFLDQFGRSVRMAQYQETLPNGRRYRVIEKTDLGPLDNTPVYYVPDNHYFLMGDNRDNSIDSRVLERVGYVPYENFVGRASFVFFSLKVPFWQVWRWPFEMRYERFFLDVNRNDQS